MKKITNGEIRTSCSSCGKELGVRVFTLNVPFMGSYCSKHCLSRGKKLQINFYKSIKVANDSWIQVCSGEDIFTPTERENNE